MPLWGIQDSKTVTGTITATQASATVAGVGTTFTTQLKAGQTLLIAGVEYRIAKITSNTALTLEKPYAAVTGSGLTVTANEQPAYVPSADLDKVFGISVSEAQAAGNISKGINSPGWVKYATHTDAQGQTRHKAETLVAFAGIAGDADTFAPVPVITISGQPASATASHGSTATFSVTATATLGGALSYQWQKQESGAGAWTNISGATSASYTTGSLTVAADNTDKYRVVVSATLGALSVTSSAATLTVIPVITISAQPANTSVTEPNPATFSVTASVTSGATLSYQWQKQESGAGAWSNVAGATSASYTTGATTVADDDTDKYRVVVSATLGAVSVTSSAATLSVSGA